MLGLVVVTGVWFLVAAMTWFDTRHELGELLDGHLAQAAALLVAQQVPEFEREHLRENAPSLHRYAPRVAFQVFHEGRLMLRSSNAPAEPMIAGQDSLRSGFDTVSIDGAQWRVFATHGAENDVQVFVGEEVKSRTEILRSVLRNMLWPLAIALPLLAVLMWWAVRRGFAPLRVLSGTLETRQPNELQPISLGDTPDEMAPLLFALNNLFERIGILLESERRFTADAAHELRTPIAAIRAQAQVALNENDDAARRHALQNTIEGCDRAARLVEQLLTLSRLEAQEETGMTPVDLSAVASQVMAELAPKSLERGQIVELDAPQHCSIKGNAVLVEVLIRNLIDNAMRYSPPSAHILVTLRHTPDGVTLSVEDSGPGIGDADRARLGQRFFRIPGSAESGSGLGWSIVRRIADLHHLQIKVDSSTELGGLAVHLFAHVQARDS
jgi:two-component system sensor histidine kinase QseC